MLGEPPSGSKSTHIISKDSNFNQTSLLKITKIGYALAMEIIQAMLISPFAVWIFSFSIC